MPNLIVNFHHTRNLALLDQLNSLDAVLYFDSAFFNIILNRKNCDIFFQQFASSRSTLISDRYSPVSA